MNSKSHLVSIVCAFFLAVILSGSSHAKEIQGWDGSFSKLHAFVPVVLYKEGFYPVVGVKKKKPLIDVDGRLVSLEKDTFVLLFRCRKIRDFLKIWFCITNMCPFRLSHFLPNFKCV